MKKHIKLIIFVLIIFFLSACGPNPVAVGEEAPNFTLRNLEGEEVSLKDNKGQAVLINFWGAWCPPCTIEMPDIVDRSITHSDELVVMAVNYGDNLNTVRDFADTMSSSFSPLLDLTGDVVDLYLVSGYPTSIFIDSEGVIQMIHVGYMDAEQLDQYLSMVNVGGE